MVGNNQFAFVEYASQGVSHSSYDILHITGPCSIVAREQVGQLYSLVYQEAKG